MTIKKLALPFLCSLMLFKLNAQTTLAAGDIAFTGLNSTSNTINDFVNTPQSESNREFCFILLKEVTAGTTIFFTDFGWRTDAQAFQSANPAGCPSPSGALTDGVVRWQANSTLPYGTQIVVRCVTNPKSNVGTASGTQGTFNNNSNYVTLAAPGEAVFAFTGTLAAPTLIGGISASPNGWAATLNNCDYTPTPSSLPNVLNNSLNGNQNYAFAVLPPNGSGYSMRLKSDVRISTDPSEARATIYTPSNWESNGSASAYLLPSNTGNVVLPVTFEDIQAVVKDNLLSVQWKTASETNCKGYTIEASADGNEWTTIGAMSSKGDHGNSSVPLSYELSIDLSNIALSLAGFVTMILVTGRKRKANLLFFAITAMLIFAACTKSNDRKSLDTNSKVFIRIAQQDIDGKVSYSKVVEAVAK